MIASMAALPDFENVLNPAITITLGINYARNEGKVKLIPDKTKTRSQYLERVPFEYGLAICPSL